MDLYYYYISAQIEFIDTKDEKSSTIMNTVIQLESPLINKAQLINIHEHIAKKFIDAADKKIVKTVTMVAILSLSCLGQMSEEFWNAEPKKEEEKPE